MSDCRHFPYLKAYRSSTALALGDGLIIRLAARSFVVSASLILTKDGENPVEYPMQKSSCMIESVDSGDWFFDGNQNEGSRGLGLKIDWAKPSTLSDDYGVFETFLNIGSTGLYFYHFEIVYNDGGRASVGRDDFCCALMHSEREWPLVVFDATIPAPTKLAGGLIYQIMVDRFCIGGRRERNKSYAKYRDDWQGIPDYGEGGVEITNTDFFGGNLRGITAKLDYLVSLGVTTIYLNPIFEARSSHKYDTGNYLKIDPDFGTESDFDELIAQSKKRGIGVVLDGVFSHTGDDSIYFNKYGNYDGLGAYQSPDSPYYSWYSFSHYPDKYDCWWGITTLPNVNENNAHYTEFVCGQNGVVATWVKKGIAGWRLDVADELPCEFLGNLCRAIKRFNKDAFVIGEVWENAATKISYSVRRRYFLGGQLDSVTNYPLKDAIIKFVSGRGVADICSVILDTICTYPDHVCHNLMNILGTHDTLRIRTALAHHDDTSSRWMRAHCKCTDPIQSRQKQMLAAILQFMLIGVPCVYYGDEAGLEGFEDPFNRRCYPWGNEDNTLIDFYKKLSEIRKKHRNILGHGGIKIHVARDNLLVFSRYTDQTAASDNAESSDKLVVIVNLCAHEACLNIEGRFVDELTDTAFAGSVGGNSAVILRRA